jgi:hypothetical protein
MCRVGRHEVRSWLSVRVLTLTVEMRLWDGTIGTLAVTRMLEIAPSRLREIAEPLGFRSLNGRWDVTDVKKIATRLVVVGSELERGAAKTALTGPLKGPVDPAAFNDWDWD